MPAKFSVAVLLTIFVMSVGCSDSSQQEALTREIAELKSQLADQSAGLDAAQKDLRSVQQQNDQLNEQLKAQLSANKTQDGDRAAAAHLLSLGGTVTAIVAGKKVELKPTDNLPDGQMSVTACGLRNDNFTSADVVHLQAMQRLESLGIAFKSLSDSDLEKIAQLNSLKSLHVGRYRTSMADVTDNAIQQLAKLPNLTNLTLEGLPSVSGAGLASLQQTPFLAHLKIESMKHLSNEDVSVLRNIKQLKQLSLGYTGLLASEKVKQLPAAPSLVFHYCNFDDKGIDALCGVAKQGTTQMRFQFCKVSLEQQERMKTTVPDCRLSFYRCN